MGSFLNLVGVSSWNEGKVAIVAEILAGPTAPEAPKLAVAAKPPTVPRSKTTTHPLFLGVVQMINAPLQAPANAVAISVKPDIREDASAWTVSSSVP